MIKRYFTTAPESYDYDYVATVATGIVDSMRGQKWRLVETGNPEYFVAHQMARYFSGAHGCFEEGSENAESFGLRRPLGGLPGSADRLQAIATGVFRKLKDGQSFQDFLYELTPNVRDAVVLCEFDRQMSNGGLSFWAQNNAVGVSDFLIHALKKVGTENAKKAQALALLSVQKRRALGEDGVETALDETGCSYFEYRDALLAEAATAFLNPKVPS